MLSVLIFDFFSVSKIAQCDVFLRAKAKNASEREEQQRSNVIVVVIQ
jgi:hypothetical protein